MNNMNDMRKLMETIQKIEEGAEYSLEGALFAAGFEAGYESPAYTEDLIKQAFYDFAGSDAKYTIQEGGQAEKIAEAPQSTPQEFAASLQQDLWEVEKKAMSYTAALNKMVADGDYSAEEHAGAMAHIEEALSQMRDILHELR